jgi:hypothetical protein
MSQVAVKRRVYREGGPYAQTPGWGPDQLPVLTAAVIDTTPPPTPAMSEADVLTRLHLIANGLRQLLDEVQILLPGSQLTREVCQSLDAVTAPMYGDADPWVMVCRYIGAVRKLGRRAERLVYRRQLRRATHVPQPKPQVRTRSIQLDANVVDWNET